MGAIELRNKIIQLINTDNVNYLKDIFDFAENKKRNISKDKIVAYTVQGTPLTKAMYVKKIKDAEASVKAGNYTTVEDLEKEVENW